MFADRGENRAANEAQKTMNKISFFEKAEYGSSGSSDLFSIGGSSLSFLRSDCISEAVTVSTGSGESFPISADDLSWG